MFSNKRIIAFVIYAICLLGIPAKMIFDQNKVFHEGNAYKFKCQPMDPNDPFRGKYVRLAFEPVEVSNNSLNDNNPNYGVVTVDDKGYAHINSIVDMYSDNLTLIEISNMNYLNDSTTQFTLPFDRLYMNENKAQAAEDLYRNALNDTTQDVYAKVYIYRGRYLLDDVYVNGVKLRDAIE